MQSVWSVWKLLDWVLADSEKWMIFRRFGWILTSLESQIWTKRRQIAKIHPGHFFIIIMEMRFLCEELWKGEVWSLGGCLKRDTEKREKLLGYECCGFSHGCGALRWHPNNRKDSYNTPKQYFDYNLHAAWFMCCLARILKKVLWSPSFSVNRWMAAFKPQPHLQSWSATNFT